MSGIEEFLRARLDEDERLAREEQARRQKWQRELAAQLAAGNVPSMAFVEYDEPGKPGDPARVLAEVAAKRALLATVIDADPFDALGAESAYEQLIVEHLAAAYVDHPDYREEWWKP